MREISPKLGWERLPFYVVVGFQIDAFPRYRTRNVNIAGHRHALPRQRERYLAPNSETAFLGASMCAVIV